MQNTPTVAILIYRLSLFPLDSLLYKFSLIKSFCVETIHHLKLILFDIKMYNFTFVILRSTILATSKYKFHSAIHNFNFFDVNIYIVQFRMTFSILRGETCIDKVGIMKQIQLTLSMSDNYRTALSFSLLTDQHSIMASILFQSDNIRFSEIFLSIL